MALFRWPGGWDMLENLRTVQREMDRLVGRGVFGEGCGIGGGSYPPVNVYNGPDEIIVDCELAGVPREDVDLSITGETLVIKGAKKPPPGEEKLRYQRRERGSGQFSRTIVLPEKVDADSVAASMRDGILSIRLPKSEAARPKQVLIQ